MMNSRSPRAALPQVPDVPVEIPAPPSYPETPELNLWITFAPVVAIGTMVLIGLAAGGGTMSYLVLMTPVMLGMYAWIAVYAGRVRKRNFEARLSAIRVDYLRSLNYKRARLQAAHDAHRAVLDIAFPPPEALAGQRQHFRRPTDIDFTAFRVGTAALPAPIRISSPDPDRSHPLLPYALTLAEEYRVLHDAPAALRLSDGAVGIAGAREAALDLIRAAILHLALRHSPADLRIHVIAPTERADDWRWLEWLPHASTAGRSGAADLMAFGAENIRALSATLMQSFNERRESAGETPFLLLIADSYGLPPVDALRAALADGAAFGASALVIAHTPEQLPGDCAAIVSVQPDRRMRCVELIRGREYSGRADALSAADAERIARAQAASSNSAPDTGRLPRTVDFLSLYGAQSADDLFGQIAFRWRGLVRGGQLPRPVPIGMESASVTVEMALAEGQHGPHGMLAGTTGAGKSEMLQTLICALAVEHDPRLVNFLLIDFKGGSAFNHFSRLPHTVGMVTNLDGGLIERVLAALKGEITARQNILRGLNLRDVTQYHRIHTTTPAQMAAPNYQPLPHLFVIVDEFAQLARDFPDFLTELVRVAQLGRSLGLHLILGTQSPAEVVTDEMVANLQFRISFRVQTIEASRAVLRRPDAAYLPADWPGRAYMQVGERGVFRQFQTAYTGGDYRHDSPHGEDITLELITADGGVIDLLDDTQPMETDNLLPTTVAQAVVETILRYTQMNDIPFMPPLLLPPLGEQVPLRSAYTAAGIEGWNGLTWPAEDYHGAAPVGLIDDTGQRRQSALWLDVQASTLITGAPGSGKTVALSTLALSLALLHAPDKLHLYALSLTGSLALLGNLPHAQAVGADTERVRRLFRRLINLLDARQKGESPTPLIGLLLDGFETFRDAYYDDHLGDLERLIAEGRTHGIAVALTATSISALPERLRALIPRRIALRPANDSEWGLTAGLHQRMDGHLPAGRGLMSGTPPLHIQFCLPSEFPVETLATGIQETGAEMRLAYHQRTGREHAPLPVMRLPARVPFAPHAGEISPALGLIDDDAQTPFTFNWRSDTPYIIVAGGPRTGKTNLLHAAALGAALASGPDTLRIFLLDFTGRSLRVLAGLPHAVHITDPQTLDAAIADIPADPRHTLLLMDDYDLAADVLNAEGGAALRNLRDLTRLHPHLHIWAAGYFDRASDPLIRHLMMKRAGFALGGRDGLNALALRAAPELGDLSAAGRAVYAQDNRLTVLQTALVEDAAYWVAQIQQKWGAAPQPQPARVMPPAQKPPTLDIDTGGLIDDLLGGEHG